MPADLDALLYPTIGLREYQVLDPARLVTPLMTAWEKGLMTYSEVRSMLGYSGANADDVIEQWKEDRRKLGLSESPDSGSIGTAAPPGAEKGGDEDEDKDDDSDDEDEEDDDDDDA